MDDLRYPIGKYEPSDVVTSAMRTAWIQDVAAVPDALVAAVKGLDDRQLSAPYRPAGWTVRQVVHHLADAYMNSYIRFKWALTEERPTIKAFDEVGWAALPDSESTPVVTSLSLLGALTDRWVYVLHGMNDADFQRTFVHPVGGEMTLERALGMYAWHGRHHVAHITSLRDRMGWS